MARKNLLTGGTPSALCSAALAISPAGCIAPRRERFDFPFGEPIARHVWQTQKSSEIREDGAGPSRNRRPRSAGIYPQLAVGRNYSGAERVRGRRALADADPEKRIARTTL